MGHSNVKVKKSTKILLYLYIWSDQFLSGGVEIRALKKKKRKEKANQSFCLTTFVRRFLTALK